MSWQDKYLNKLDLTAKQAYLINDPDQLCLVPAISEAIDTPEVTLVDMDDFVSLRLLYENWLETDSTKAFLIRIAEQVDTKLPFDIERDSITVDFSISDVLPELDSSVVCKIQPDSISTLIKAVNQYRPGKLGKTATLDFILRHLFKIAPEIIQTESDLVRLLIRKHYIGSNMPQAVEHHLTSYLQLNSLFSDWDFNLLIPNRTAFFDFLQQQWTLYVHTLTCESEISEPWPTQKLIVPFDDQDIQVYVDNLFADGLLRPVEMKTFVSDHWAKIGVITEQNTPGKTRFEHLLKSINISFNDESCLTESADFWGDKAFELGILNALSHKPQVNELLSVQHKTQLVALNERVDGYFENWLESRFTSLINIPSNKHPNMLHKVPDWLNKRVQSDQKVCLLVMDGMGFQQWAIFREELNSIEAISLDEYFSFALVPTITSISRQALFSGKLPFYYADSLLTTAKESKLWQTFWEDKGLKAQEVTYAKKVEKIESNDEFYDLVAKPSLKVAGLVVNFVDEQMHGMKAGMIGLNSVVSTWCKTWDFKNKIKGLVDAGYEVIITADHGNQEAIGCGALNQGVQAETKGERVRIYESELTAESSAEKLGDNVLKWPGQKYGLPQDRHPVVSKGRHAFVTEGKKIVGHGGISLHEVIVPLAVVKRSDIKW